MMRAKQINEFEQGGDPYEKLRIGQHANPIKQLEEVKVGDIATDYNDYKWEVLGKGIGYSEFMHTGSQYDESGVAQEMFDEYDNEELEWIAAYSSDYHEASVFSYGYDGAVVYKENQSIKEFKQGGNSYEKLRIGQYFNSIKAFSEVEIGDIATDNNNNELEVMAVGTGYNSFDRHARQYDEDGNMTSFFEKLDRFPDEYALMGAFKDQIEWIACWNGDEQYSDVYHYGSNGAWVSESNTYMNESAVSHTLMNLRNELTTFLKGVVIPQSKGHVKDERSAAIHLYDILKERYKIGS